MKLHIMYDQTGRIAAAVRLDADESKQRDPRSMTARGAQGTHRHARRGVAARTP